MCARAAVFFFFSTNQAPQLATAKADRDFCRSCFPPYQSVTIFTVNFVCSVFCFQIFVIGRLQNNLVFWQLYP